MGEDSAQGTSSEGPSLTAPKAPPSSGSSPDGGGSLGQGLSLGLAGMWVTELADTFPH